MFDEKSRLKIALIGIGIGFVAGIVKCFLNFPIVEFYAFVSGPVLAYIVGKSYTDGKYADPTK
jgi:hypothetical protein